MKKMMVAVGLLVGASVFAEVPDPEVCFSFDDEVDAGLHVNEGTAGAVANLTDSYSTYGRGRGALYDVGSGRIGVYGYSPWCRELALGDSFTVAMSFKASAAPNEILFCLGDLDGSGQVLMVTTEGEASVKVVVAQDRQVFEEALLPVSGGSDRSHLLCLGYANGTFSASVDGGSSVAVGCNRPTGGFQILGGRSTSQILPAPFVHGCGVVDPQSGVVSHPNAANVVDDLRIWTTQMLSDEQTAELVASRFGDVTNAVSDVDQSEAVNTAIRRVVFGVGYFTEFLGYGWRLYKRDDANCYLFTTGGIDRVAFSNGKDDPDYAKSDFRKRINEFEKQFRGYDGPQMSWDEVDGRGSGYIRQHDLSDVIKEPYDDYLFLMSMDEATAMGTSALARDVLNLGDIWYLRTRGVEDNGNVCVVIKGGYISEFGTKAHIRQYVRPSLKVSLNSPLFTRPFFRTNGDASENIKKSDVEIGQGFAFGDYFEDWNGEEENYKITYRESEIAAPEELWLSQPSGWLIEVPESVLEKGVLRLKDTMPVLSHSPRVSYRSSAIADGSADHLAVIAVRGGNLSGLIIDYAKVSAAAEGTDVVIPFGKLPRGHYKLSFFSEKCETGADDHCSKEVGGFNVENVDGRSKDGEWPVSVSNRLFTVRAEGVEIRFPEDVGFVQDFEAGQSGVTFSGLGVRGGRIDGKVTVDAAMLTVSNMTLSTLAVTNGGVLNVTGKLAIASPDETLVDGSIVLSAGSVLDVKGGRCVVKNVSGAGSVTNSVPEGAGTAAFVIANRLTVDVTRTDTLSAKVPLALGTDFKVFVTNANDDVHGEWTILTASQIVAKPDEIKVVADDEDTGPWEVKIVDLSDGQGKALVLVNSDEYVRVKVGRLEYQSAVWTCGDGAVTNRVENGFFDVQFGMANTRVIFSPDYGYQFASGESGVRNLPSPIVEKCTVTPPVVMRSPCAVTFTVDASIAQAVYVVEGVTNELSVGLNQVDVPFGSVVELIVREAARYYPYVGPHAFRVTVLEMSVEIAAKPIPKGIEGNPFEIGENLFATTNTEGVLTITGTGAMDDFPSAADIPWVASEVSAVTIGDGVSQIGANAWTGMSGDVIVDSGLLLSRYAFVGDGFASAESPVGEISGGEFNRIAIIDGKVYLGVSVATNADLTATTETWRQADIEDVRKEDDGTVTLMVPAPAEKGFMILKSKPAK